MCNRQCLYLNADADVNVNAKMSMPRFPNGRKNYIKYESKGDRNKTLSAEKYLYKISPYLKGINNLKKSDSWKFNQQSK